MTQYHFLVTSVLEGAAAVLLTYACWSYLTPEAEQKRAKGKHNCLVGASSAFPPSRNPSQACCGGLENSRQQCGCGSSFPENHTDGVDLSPPGAETSDAAPTTSASGCGDGCGSCSSNSAPRRSDTAGGSSEGIAAKILYLSQTGTSKKLAEELGVAMKDAQMPVQVGVPSDMSASVLVGVLGAC